jgi:hypothetical protein
MTAVFIAGLIVGGVVALVFAFLRDWLRPLHSDLRSSHRYMRQP